MQLDVTGALAQKVLDEQDFTSEMVARAQTASGHLVSRAVRESCVEKLHPAELGMIVAADDTFFPGSVATENGRELLVTLATGAVMKKMLELTKESAATS